MNGGDCQRHADSRWVQAANRFLDEHTEDLPFRAHVSTIQFLLQNGHCGMRRRTSIQGILQHLEQQGIPMSREEFQQGVRGDLKRAGAVATLVYPGRIGGVFIPCNENDVRRAMEQVIGRVTQELENFRGLTNEVDLEPVMERLTQMREALRTSLSEV